MVHVVNRVNHTRQYIQLHALPIVGNNAQILEEHRHNLTPYINSSFVSTSLQHSLFTARATHTVQLADSFTLRH